MNGMSFCLEDAAKCWQQATFLRNNSSRQVIVLHFPYRSFIGKTQINGPSGVESYWYTKACEIILSQ